MIEIAEIQSAYNSMYAIIRNYFWPMDVVEKLVDLEVECYKSFPDMQRLKVLFDNLYRELEEVAREDEDLKSECLEFKKLLDSNDTVYNRLNKVNEVLNNESNEIN